MFLPRTMTMKKASSASIPAAACGGRLYLPLLLALFLLALAPGGRAFQQFQPSRSSRRRRVVVSAAMEPGDVSGRTYDLAVIGGGPVGVSAALLAASKGASVVLIDAPRASGALMNEATGEDLSLGGPTGLFSKALRASVKRISVSSLKGMGLRDDRCVSSVVVVVVIVRRRRTLWISWRAIDDARGFYVVPLS